MKLLNFCVGRVQTVQIGGEAVRTAHVKAPVPQPWKITADGAVGDERAVHPDKIYVFARSAYEFWGRYFNVSGDYWPDGFFGENLTLDELDERDVRIGDEFSLGEEVRLVVTGARTPCIKLAWRLNQPRSFTGTFAKSRHTGAYLGVLQAGVVRPGAELRRTRHDPRMPNIAEVCDLVASRQVPAVEPLERLLAFDKLSPTIRFLLGRKLEAARRAASEVQGRWQGWRRFVVERIVAETEETRSLYVRAADEEPLCQPRPGQFVSVRMERKGQDTVTRTWSLSHFSYEMDFYRLTVRRQGGAGSEWIHGAVEGSSLMLRAPAGEFALDMSAFRPLVLVAGGIGITPLFAMLQAHLLRQQDTPVRLLYGARTPADVVFRAELEALAAKQPNLHIQYFYSRHEGADRPAGRINPQEVIDSLRDLYLVLEGRRIPVPWYEADIYLCGPGEFCSGLKAGLVARGANADHVFTELFVAASAGKSLLEEAEVCFQRSGVTQHWKADEDLTLLEIAERAGLELKSDCRAGACLTCKTAVLSGETTSDLGDGSALLCVGQPGSPRLVLDC